MTAQYKMCNCNRTMPLDAAAGAQLGQALGTGPLPVATELCRHEAGRLREAMQGSDGLIIGCTQERARFEAMASETQAVEGKIGKAVAPLRFVNIRETANWSREANAALPKTAALLAQAALPAPDPVPGVSYVSEGRTLIIGEAGEALEWARALSPQLKVTVLLTGGHAPAVLGAEQDIAVHTGRAIEISGWLGAFAVRWEQDNPIDSDRCVRCNACLRACPEGAIDTLYRIDMGACRRHGDCVTACGAAGAIDFTRGAALREAGFDLVFDLSPAPLIPLHQPPQGYFAPGADKGRQTAAALQLVQMVGEFEKPKYFHYKERLCAHSRNRQAGCSACIDVCSAKAIAGAGDRIKVNPHLCMGCGACATVCPSGALGYAYPAAPHLGKRFKTLLETYAKAGGRDAALLLHSGKKGRELIMQSGRMAAASKQHDGLPARLIPVEVHHTASAGIDLWLAAIAYGASGIAVLVTGEEAPRYVEALAAQMTIAQTILSALGYAGEHFRLLRAATPQELDAACALAPLGQAPASRAAFHVAAQKRNTLDFVFDHLYRHAPAPVREVALPPQSPFGAIRVDTSACTLCMSCVGACPGSALMSGLNAPQLRFIERNCVQCGLCVQTCPEDALTLAPRLSFAETAATPQVLNETQPFHCIRCDKPFGTLRMVEAMIGRLSGHGAFIDHPERLKMCGDCRVADMMMAGDRRLADRHG